MPVCRLLHAGRLAYDGVATRVLRRCPSTVMVRLRALVMRLRARLARLRVLLTRLRAPMLRLRARMLRLRVQVLRRLALRLRRWARRRSLRALFLRLPALWLRQWVLGVRLRARRRRLVVLWERFGVQWMRGGVWFVERLQLVNWRLLVPVVGRVMLCLCMASRWRICRACVWLMLVSVWLWRGLELGSCPGRVLLRTRAVTLRLRAAGRARVSVASRWALRSGSCRLGCALVGAASYTNGLGMALLSPSMCRSSRSCQGRCLMGMDRHAILLLFKSGQDSESDRFGHYLPRRQPPDICQTGSPVCHVASIQWQSREVAQPRNTVLPLPSLSLSPDGLSIIDFTHCNTFRVLSPSFKCRSSRQHNAQHYRRPGAAGADAALEASLLPPFAACTSWNVLSSGRSACPSSSLLTLAVSDELPK